MSHACDVVILPTRMYCSCSVCHRSSAACLEGLLKLKPRECPYEVLNRVRVQIWGGTNGRVKVVLRTADSACRCRKWLSEMLRKASNVKLPYNVVASIIQHILSDGLPHIDASVLSDAVWQCDPYIVRALLDAAPEGSVNAPDRRGWTPLHYAVHFGKLEHTELLLGLGADPNAMTTGCPLEGGVFVGQTLDRLVRELEAMDVHDSRRRALEDGLYRAKDVGAKLMYIGASPLHMAAFESGKDAVAITQALLDRGARANLVNVHGFTPAEHGMVFSNILTDRYLGFAGGPRDMDIALATLESVWELMRRA